MRILVVIALAMLAGCSSAPPKPETTAVNAAPVTNDAAAAERTSEAAAEGASEAKAFKPPPGYKAKIQDWNVVYCRKTTVLGSRFPQEVCMTEGELKEHMAAMETMKRDKDQVSRVCSMAAGCANQ